MSLSRFESMLKTNKVYFFDSSEFEEIIHHYIDIGKQNLAKKAVKLGLEQHPSSVLLKLLQAEILIYEDEIASAKKILNEIQSIEPTNEEVYIQKAAIFSKEHNHEAAIEQLKKALEYTDDIPDVASLLGMEYLYLDNFEQARLNFSICLEDDIEDYSSLYNVIYCFDMEEKNAEAIEYLTNFINVNPYCEVAWHQIGRQYMILEDYENALKSFDYAVLIDEFFIGAYLEKAKTLESLNRFEEAIEDYKITLTLDDPTAYVYMRIGECYKKMLKFSKALKFYQKAVNEDPLLDKAWVALADVCCLLDDFETAQFYLKKVVEIDEFNPTYWAKYGELNLKLGFYEEAAESLKKCLSLETENLEVWVALVDVLYYIGSYAEALEKLVLAKKQFDPSAEIEYRMFGVFMELQNEKDALLHLKNGLAIDFEFCNVFKELYPGFFKLKSVKKAIEDTRKQQL